MTERPGKSGQKQPSENSANENDYANRRQAENENARLNHPPAKHLAGTQAHDLSRKLPTENTASGNRSARRWLAENDAARFIKRTESQVPKSPISNRERQSTDAPVSSSEFMNRRTPGVVCCVLFGFFSVLFGLQDSEEFDTCA